MLRSKMHCSDMNGFSLVEFLIALTVNIILLMALIGVFSSNLGNYNQMTMMDKLNQQLQFGMNTMVNDIRRAGFWANASTDIGSPTVNNNPFMATANDLTISGSCILFTFDTDKNGGVATLSSSGDDERYGFKLTSQTLQSRPPGGTYSCTASNWVNVTDPNIVLITNLSFTLVSHTVPPGTSSKAMQIRGVTISMTGQLATNSTVTKTITQYVKIRNDKYLP